jgi:predicted MPP superfamily phosphohydrolase
VFRVIFNGAWTLLHIYVFWRLLTLPWVRRRVSWKVLLPLGLLLWSTGFLRRYLDTAGMEALAAPLEWFVMNWLGTLFLVFICLLAVDIVTLFGLLFRRRVVLLRSAAFIAGMVLAATAFVQGLRAPVVTDYEVRLSHLPAQYDGLVVAVISDMHVGRFIDRDWLGARVDQINAMDPDLVVMPGDLFEGDRDSERESEMQITLRRLVPPLGVWGVTGNHEGHGGRDAAVRFLEVAGVRILRDEWVELAPGLVIGGVDDGGHGLSGESDAARIRQVLADKPANTASIFLSHRPQFVDQVASAGVDLMISGHTHGGQIWPFSYVVKAVNPLLAGRYELGQLTVFVSRGAGTWGPRMRLWAPGEILRITLRSGTA